jgi:hypothetical protein
MRWKTRVPFIRSSLSSGANVIPSAAEESRLHKSLKDEMLRFTEHDNNELALIAVQLQQREN